MTYEESIRVNVDAQTRVRLGRDADAEIAALKAENERLGIALQSIADLDEDAWGKASVVVEYIDGYPREELEGVNASEIARKALEEKP